MTTPTTARRPQRPRATPAYIVPVAPLPPAPLLRVFIPGNAPSANHMYAARGRGAARYLTTEAVAWREAVALSVMRWRFSERAPRPDLAVSFTWVGMRSDIDNPVKLTLDGVKLGLAVDDAYVSELRVTKRPLAHGGERGAWIEVSELPPAQHTQPRASRTRNKATDKRTA